VPLYSFIHEKTGDVIEAMYPIRQGPPQRIRRKGRVYVHAIGLDHARYRNSPGAWPMRTIGLDGVAPSQAGEMNQYLIERGVPPCAQSDGTMLYSDNTHRNKVLAARGLIDRDGCYRQRTTQVKEYSD
jgi:hypothetical protein